MGKKIIIINGNNFSSIEGFYDEIEQKLTNNLQFGRNLDALNDVFCGGFEIFDYQETICLIWEKSLKSKIELGGYFDEIIGIIRDYKHIELKLL